MSSVQMFSNVFSKAISAQRSLGAAPRRRVLVVTNAKKEEDPSVDWDAAWRTFKSEDNQGSSTGRGPGRKSTVNIKSPRLAGGRANQWNRGPTRDDIRRQETRLLDIWTTESFSQLGILAVVLLFIGLLIVAGPPPTDRCTLPWC